MAKKTLSFIPEIVNLKLYAGDGNGMLFTITNTSAEVLPLTGDVKAQIRAEREADDPALVELDCDLTNFEDGKVLVSWTGVQTHSLIEDGATFVGVWDLEWTPEDGEPLTLVQGEVECFPDVTH